MCLKGEFNKYLYCDIRLLPTFNSKDLIMFSIMSNFLETFMRTKSVKSVQLLTLGANDSGHTSGLGAPNRKLLQPLAMNVG